MTPQFEDMRGLHGKTIKGMVSVDPDAEHEVRADEVRPGDYLLGLGRVQSCNDSGGPAPRRRVTLFSEGGDWTVSLNPRARVVVIHAR